MMIIMRQLRMIIIPIVIVVNIIITSYIITINKGVDKIVITQSIDTGVL